jgi:hypothetical protein
MLAYIASVEVVVYAEANQFVIYGDGADSNDFASTARPLCGTAEERKALRTRRRARSA